MPVIGEMERRANIVGSDRKLLLRELRESRALLIKELRVLFNQYQYQFAERRLVSKTDPRITLQWQTRLNPSAPESYENQQTNRGIVKLVQYPDSQLKEKV